MTGAAEVVLAQSRPDHYVDPLHAAAIRAADGLRELGAPVDIITVADAMADFGDRRHILARLIWCAESVPSTQHADYYARSVRDSAVARWLVTHLRGTADEVSSAASGKLDVARAALARMASDVADTSPSGLVSITGAALGWIAAIESSPGRIYWPTGLAAIDGADRSRGLSAGQLIVVGARPGVGKTAFAISAALEVARHTRVLFVSLEMGDDEIMIRAIGQTSGVDTRRLESAQRIRAEDWPAIGLACSRLSERSLDFAARSRCTMQDVAALAAATPSYGVVVIDYIGLMASTDANPYQSREQEIAAISRGLKALAMERQICVVALSQINREAAKREDHEPRLSDLRDSGALEQDADCVVLLHRPHVFDHESDAREAVAIVAKRRSGPIGRYAMRFEPETQRFCDA